MSFFPYKASEIISMTTDVQWSLNIRFFLYWLGFHSTIPIAPLKAIDFQ